MNFVTTLDIFVCDKDVTLSLQIKNVINVTTTQIVVSHVCIGNHVTTPWSQLRSLLRKIMERHREISTYQSVEIVDEFLVCDVI